VRALLVTAVVAFGLVAAPAQADPARPWVPARLTDSVAGPHFVVHYATDETTTAVATNVLGHAERAYALEVGSWGYPAPIDDGDGKVDVYVYAREWTDGDAAGAVSEDSYKNAPRAGYITLKTPYADSVSLVAHEFFHVVQLAMWSTAVRGFMLEATADWAAARVSGRARGYWAYPDVSLDCVGRQCGPTLETQGGYIRWPFFAFLDEQFGMGIVREIWRQPGTTLDAIDSALRAHGSSLSEQFTAFQLDAGNTMSALPDAMTLGTGTTRASFTVAPLAAHNVWLTAPRISDVACGPAQLQVAALAGPGARVFFRQEYGPPQELATGVPAALPWRTCAAKPALVQVVVPGGQAAAVDVSFTVTALDVEPPTLTVISLTAGPERSAVTLALRTAEECVIEVEVEGVRSRTVLYPGGVQDVRVNGIRPQLKRGRHYLTYTVVSASGARSAAKRIRFAV
jgi:hypothetical protein